jgi:Fe2+ or Zn2+ uptake regulation protein
VSKPLSAQTALAPAASTVEDVLALVRARGGRVTSPRRVILEALFEAAQPRVGAGHLTAPQLAEAVHHRAPDVHMSTVYRNLDDLQRMGVVVHSHMGHGPATYQLASLAHAHFICEACGATVEAPETLVRELAREAQTELGFSIDPYHFAILGRCAACQ